MGFSKQAVEYVEIICYNFYNRIIYVHKILCSKVKGWYHVYLNHSRDGRLANATHQVCYWKVLVTKEDAYVNPCKTCQKFKMYNR